MERKLRGEIVIEDLKYLSRNQIHRIIDIIGNFQHLENDNFDVNMGDIIHTLNLFEDKGKTRKEKEDFLKQFNK